MQAFLLTILSFPSVVFTALLSIALLYWLVLIAGAIDLDLLDSALGLDSMEAALDGALDTLDGVTAEALDAGGEALEAGAEAVEAADSGETARAGALSGLLNVLGVRGVPVTIVGSFVLLWAFVLSFTATKLLGPIVSSLLVGSFVGALSLVGSLALAAVTARPFRGLFVTHTGTRRASLVGKTCTVLSGRVDGTTGRAEIDDGGSGFVAEVRCPQDNALQRGSKALVYQYEPREGIFFIGPVDDALVRASEEGEP